MFYYFGGRYWYMGLLINTEIKDSFSNEYIPVVKKETVYVYLMKRYKEYM